MTKTEKRPAPTYKLKPSRLDQGESKIRYWFAVPEAGTPYEALFDPVYWDAFRTHFAIGDYIRVEPDEGHYTADLKVVSTGTGGTRVLEFYKKDWDKVEAPKTMLSEYRTRYAGPHHKWRVERLADDHVEQTGFTSESDANRWMADNMKALQTRAAA